MILRQWGGWSYRSYFLRKPFGKSEFKRSREEACAGFKRRTRNRRAHLAEQGNCEYG